MKKKVKEKNSSGVSAQEFIEVEDIYPETILMKDRRLVRILKVGAINTELLSSDELEQVFRKFEVFLSGLSFPIQIEVVSEPVNLQTYIEGQQKIMERETNPHKRYLLESYLNYTKDISASREIIRRQRYLIFDQAIQGSEENALEDAFFELDQKSERIREQLKSMDLDWSPMSQAEIIKCFQVFFNFEESVVSPIETVVQAPFVTRSKKGVVRSVEVVSV